MFDLDGYRSRLANHSRTFAVDYSMHGYDDISSTSGNGSQPFGNAASASIQSSEEHTTYS